jgi:hypothetical protein
VLFQSCGNCFGISDQCRAGPPRTNPTPAPKIGTDLKAITLTAMELNHSFLAFGIETGKRLLRGCDTFIRNVAQKVLGITTPSSTAEALCPEAGILNRKSGWPEFQRFSLV